MSNEREAFEQTLNPRSRERNEVGDYVSAAARDAWAGWQARAAYQRTQAQPADALVGALEQITRMTYDEWTNGAVASRIAEEALAAYRAAQEKPHD